MMLRYFYPIAPIQNSNRYETFPSTKMFLKRDTMKKYSKILESRLKDMIEILFHNSFDEIYDQRKIGKEVIENSRRYLFDKCYMESSCENTLESRYIVSAITDYSLTFNKRPGQETFSVGSNITMGKIEFEYVVDFLQWIQNGGTVDNWIEKFNYNESRKLTIKNALKEFEECINHVMACVPKNGIKNGRGQAYGFSFFISPKFNFVNNVVFLSGGHFATLDHFNGWYNGHGNFYGYEWNSPIFNKISPDKKNTENYYGKNSLRINIFTNIGDGIYKLSTHTMSPEHHKNSYLKNVEAEFDKIKYNDKKSHPTNSTFRTFEDHDINSTYLFKTGVTSFCGTDSETLESISDYWDVPENEYPPINDMTNHPNINSINFWKSNLGKSILHEYCEVMSNFITSRDRTLIEKMVEHSDYFQFSENPKQIVPENYSTVNQEYFTDNSAVMGYKINTMIENKIPMVILESNTYINLANFKQTFQNIFKQNLKTGKYECVLNNKLYHVTGDENISAFLYKCLLRKIYEKECIKQGVATNETMLKYDELISAYNDPENEKDENFKLNNYIGETHLHTVLFPDFYEGRVENDKNSQKVVMSTKKETV